MANEKLRTGDPGTRARALAYRLLARCARSVREIEERLTRKGFDPPVIARTVSHLQTAGYLDDARYAREWVAARSARYGPRRLETELRNKGVAITLIQEALKALPLEAEEARALALARRKWEQLSRTQRPLPARRQALYAYLARRGYEGEMIARILRTVCGGELD